MTAESTRPSFSVVVPVRNVERTITRTLESIIAQNGEAAEIIVIDGASTDSTLDKIKAYHPHLAAVVSEPDGGVYEAINKGLTQATGEIIAILNGDDFYQHRDVFSLYAAHFNATDAGVLYGDLEFFLPSAPDEPIRRCCSSHFTRELLAYGWMPPHPTVFVRREIYDVVGRYDPSFEIAGDFEFLVRALAVRNVEARRVPSSVVRMQYGGLSTAGLRATYKLNKEIIRACQMHGIKTNWLRLSQKVPRKLWEFRPLAQSFFRRVGSGVPHVKG
ncbi:MAG: glycosyltransferase family 2 protein [Pseudomonadota bacterium]